MGVLRHAQGLPATSPPGQTNVTDASGAWRATVERVCAFTRVKADAMRTSHNPPECVAQARMLAVYLAVVELEIGQHELARVSGYLQRTISNAVSTIEDRRDDPALDAAIDMMADELRRRWRIPDDAAAGALNDNGIAA